LPHPLIRFDEINEAFAAHAILVNRKPERMRLEVR
jgi:hypothetical protein